MKKTKTTADENNGITVVIPAYGPVSTVNHSVSSALDNYTGNKDDTASMLNIEVLIMQMILNTRKSMTESLNTTTSSQRNISKHTT